ncbi:MAG: hypothetical protein ACRDHW_00115, partial [Ktedonobacteraceae bacterium]
MSKQQQGAGEAPRSGLGILTVFVAGQRTSGAAANSQGKNRASLWQEKQEAAAVASRSRRFRLLDVACKILPEDKRLNACMKQPAVGAGYVQTMYDASTGAANFRGLCRCADGKRCAVCAAQIGEGKRADLAAGVEKCIEGQVYQWDDATKRGVVKAGGAVYLVTYTCSHKVGDDLPATIAAFTQARREMRQQR